MGAAGGLESRGAPWAPGSPSGPGLPGAATSKMLLPAGACIDGERAVAPAGSWAKPLIAHPSPPRLSLAVLPFLSALPGLAPATQHFGVRSALEGGVLGRVSARARGISAARLWLGGGDGDPAGRKLTQTLGNESSRGHRQTPAPGRDGGPVTWSRLPEGLRRPSNQGRSQAAGNGERTGKPGLWPIIYLLAHPVRPSRSEMGAGGSLGGSSADAEGV